MEAGNFFIDKATNSAYSSMVRPAPGYVDALVLVAGTSQTQNVPAGARWVLFSSSCGLIYVKANAAATVPVVVVVVFIVVPGWVCLWG